MNISKSMLNWFYDTLQRKGVSSYRGYTLKFIKKNREFRLLKNSRKLAAWFLELDDIKIYGNGRNNSEENVIKNFFYLPREAEKKYQSIKKHNQEKEQSEPLNSTSNNRDEFMNELNEACLNLKDDQITIECIELLLI